MNETISRLLRGVRDGKDRKTLADVLNFIGDRMSCQSQITAGLVIKAGGGTLVAADIPLHSP